MGLSSSVWFARVHRRVTKFIISGELAVANMTTMDATQLTTKTAATHTRKTLEWRRVPDKKKYEGRANRVHRQS